MGGRPDIQARHVNCIRWHKIHPICDFSVHRLPNVCTSQLDHNTKMTFSNGLLCKLCCNSLQTKLCQRKASLILHLTAIVFVLVSVTHVRITQQASTWIDSFNPFSSGMQQEAVVVSHYLISNLYISINGALWEDFPQQEIVKNPQSFSSVYCWENNVHTKRLIW